MPSTARSDSLKITVVMIPTSDKDKLGGRLSYPVGAAELSHALESVPQYERLSFSFHTSNSKHSRRMLREDLPRMIVVAGYNHPSWYDEIWTLYVYAVLRTNRHIAHELLLYQGLPALADWLSADRTETWRHGRHHREAWFHPLDGTITIRDDETDL